MSDMLETETTTTTVVAVSSPEMDCAYVKTQRGILRIVEIVLSIIVFICSVSNYCSGFSTAAWAAFVGFAGFMFTFWLLILSIIHLYDRHPHSPWLIVELIYYVIWALFFFIAALCLAISAGQQAQLAWSNCSGAFGVGSFFAFAAMAVFGFHSYLKYRDYRVNQSPLSRIGEAIGVL